MNFEIQPLHKKYISRAAALDKKWFAENGITEKELADFIDKNPENSLAVIQNDTLVGFGNFEVLESEMPKDYVGDAIPDGNVLFIRQFTTTTNYQIKDMSVDEVLLSAMEKKAIELGCKEVWEALDSNHPYKKENNSGFDAFGFYLSRDYHVDINSPLTWQPDSETSISCLLFRKIGVIK